MNTYMLQNDTYKPRGPLMIGDDPITYRQAGTADSSRTPLVLLHGWGGSSGYWRPTFTDLGTDRFIIAPDLPGFGDSPPLHGPAIPERMADLVIAVADALGIAQFDLNGHSFSASVAVYVAIHYPSRVRRLVLTCISTFRSERERLIVSQLHRVMAFWIKLRRPWMSRSRPFYRAVSSRFFYRTPADDALLSDAVADFLKMDQRTALETAAKAGDAAINPAFASIRCPTLVIGARQDNIMPPAGTPEVARLVPNSRLVWMEQCGHLPMIEQPAVYHRELRGFLDGPIDPLGES